MVLYDSELGYYRAGKRPRKDYLTSPEMHPVFGQTLGAYIGQVQASHGRGAVTILELGGGSGILAQQILSVLNEREQCRYIILEKGHEARPGPITWISDPADIPVIGGFTIVLANEFFDALPFHRVVNTEEGLKEIYIDYADGYVEELGALSPPVEAFLQSHPLPLNLRQAAEVTTRTRDILSDISARVEGALLLVFDYGYHTAELAHGRFFEGSMVGYKGMRLRANLYEELGSVDITHHVNFDHLSALIEHLGWTKAGESEQYRFLLNIGVLERMVALPEMERVSAKGVINPHGIGSMISVLGFTRNVAWDVPGFVGKTL